MADKVYETRPTHLSRYDSVEEWIRVLQEKSEGLEDAAVDIDIYDDYGSYSTTIGVSGSRPKNEKELAADEEKKRLDKENARKSKEAQAKAEWTQAQNLYRKYKKQLEALENGEYTGLDGHGPGYD